MKSKVVSFIGSGTTEGSRFLRFLIISLPSLMLFTVALYGIYIALFNIIPGFFFANIGFFQTIASLASNFFSMFKNYLFLFIIFFIAMSYCCFIGYERKDNRKLHSDSYGGAAFLIIETFAAVSIFFFAFVSYEKLYLTSFYHFIVLVLSSVVMYFGMISLPAMVHFSNVGDFIRHLKKIYFKNVLILMTLVVYIIFVSLVAYLSFSPESATLLFLGLFVVFIFSAVVFEEYSMLGSKGRLNTLELRGFKLPTEYTERLYPICMWDFERKLNSDCIGFIKLKGLDSSFTISIDYFREEIGNIIKEQGGDDRTLLYLNIPEYIEQNGDDGDTDFFVELKIVIYNLDNEILREFELKGDVVSGRFIK